jgi:hypothetical protein
MPIKRGKDSHGPFYQYGNKKKYYYTSGNSQSRQLARSKALKQAQAIKASQHRSIKGGNFIDDIINFFTGKKKEINKFHLVYNPNTGKNEIKGTGTPEERKEFINQQKKYYPDLEGGLLNLMKLSRDKAIKGSSKVGGSLLDTIKDKLYSLVSKDAPPSIKKLIKENGSKVIKKIVVCREPIDKHINWFLNIITLGKFDSIKKKLGYDYFFHLYMYMELEGGKKFRIEKNERVKLTEAIDKSKGECLEVPINKKVTLSEMFENAYNTSKENLWHYSADKYNCQKFIYDMLNSSGLSSDKINKFVLQDAQSLFKQLPNYLKIVSQGATDIANVFNRLVSGGKVKKITRRKRDQGDHDLSS